MLVLEIHTLSYRTALTNTNSAYRYTHTPTYYGLRHKHLLTSMHSQIHPLTRGLLSDTCTHTYTNTHTKPQEVQCASVPLEILDARSAGQRYGS